MATARRRHLGIGLGVLAAMGLMAGYLGSISGPPPGRAHPLTAVEAARIWASGTAATSIPSACTPTAPSGQIGYIYLVGEFGAIPDPNLTGNLVSQPGSLTAGPVAVPNITGTVCGYVQLTSEQSPGCPASGEVILPAQGQHFSSTIDATVTAIPGLRPLIPFHPQPGTIQGNLVCNGGSSTAGLSAAVTATVGGGAGLFGLNCVVNVTLNLIGKATGPILGTPGWYLGGDFSTNNFGIPAVTPTSSCPPGVASNLDSIVGLPLPAGAATLNLPFALELYVPSS
jgi:hypothetical protein